MKFLDFHEIFGKVISPSDLVILGGPAGGSALEKGFAPKRISHMTRRAFLALRVIQAQGKSSSRWLVKQWCKWFRKMKISQNL